MVFGVYSTCVRAKMEMFARVFMAGAFVTMNFNVYMLGELIT